MERPAPKPCGLIFTGESVRAILAGEKTVTRRIIKGAPEKAGHAIATRGYVEGNGGRPPRVLFFRDSTVHSPPAGMTGCRHVVGQRIWVREGYAFMPECDPRTGERNEFARRVVRPDGCERFVAYRATAPEFEWCDGDGFAIEGSGWRSPLMMPEWASRISLEVVDVRAERLHAIDDADAMREGVRTLDGVLGATTPRERFACHWDAINSGRAAWASNPWVLRVEFKVASIAEGTLRA
jgi:hypothetical protein